MSTDLSDGFKGDDPVARELPAMRAAWPAWVLLVIAVLVFFLQIVRQTPDDPDGLRGLALSADALAQGRWWTLVTHAVVQQGAMGHVFVMALLVGAGLSALTARDKDWMGGWRAIAVFVAASAAGAVEHLVAGDGQPLTGMWQGLAGLVGFYIASGRSPRLSREDRSAVAAKPKQAVNRAITGWVVPWLVIGNGLLGSNYVTEGAPLWILLATVFGGGLLIFAVNCWGSRRLVKLMDAAQLCAYAVLLAMALTMIFREAPPVSGPALLGGVFVGLVLGMFDQAPRATEA